MKKPDQLVVLIHSLTSSEKRYFKLFCSFQKGEKFYLQLFDFIERSESPTTEQIRKKFRNFPQINHLPRIKHYLFQLILRALRSYHEDKGVENQLFNKLSEIKLLYDKGLFDLCLDLVNKGIALSTMHHLHVHRIEFIKWKSRIADSTYNLKEVQEIMANDYVSGRHLCEELAEYFDYLRIYDQFYSYYKRKGTYAGPVDLKELERIMNSPLMDDKAVPAYFYSKMIYYSIKSTYTMLHPLRLADSIRYNELLLELLSGNQEMIRESPKTYFAVMSNQLTRLMKTKDEKLFSRHLALFRAFPEMLTADKKRYYERRVYLNSYQLEVEFYYQTGKFTRALELMRQIEKAGIADLAEVSVEVYLLMLLSFSKVLTVNGRYAESNKYLNRLAQEEGANLREDIHYNVYLLKYVNYYALKDTKGAELALRHFVKKYGAAGAQFKGDSMVTRFVLENHKTLSQLRPDVQACRELLESALELHGKDGHMMGIWYYLYVYSWLVSVVYHISVPQAFHKLQQMLNERENA